MFQRKIITDIQKNTFQREAIIIIGPRQVGKTTLMNTLLVDTSSSDILTFSGDYLSDRQILQLASKTEIMTLFHNAKYVLIDEAQKVPNIGNLAKIFVDIYGSSKQLLLTGSSTLGLLDQTTEPLTGRKRVYELYPISFGELRISLGEKNARERLEEILIYGAYPQVLGYNDYDSKKEKLRDIVSGQLYRDILEFQNIKNPDILTKLLEMLAIQVGSEVSYHKIARTIGISQQTVEKYIDLLEKSFVIFRLRPYANNKIKEITKMKKIYFTDLGIRNTLLQSYSPLHLRTDIGALWENFCVLESHKDLSYARNGGVQHFWRTKMQEEVDLLVSENGQQYGYECKWSPQKYRVPLAFSGSYPDIPIQLVTRENYALFFGK